MPKASRRRRLCETCSRHVPPASCSTMLTRPSRIRQRGCRRIRPHCCSDSASPGRLGWTLMTSTWSSPLRRFAARVYRFAAPPALISAGDGSVAAFNRVRSGDYQIATVAEPLHAAGWQLVDELNRATPERLRRAGSPEPGRPVSCTSWVRVFRSVFINKAARHGIGKRGRRNPLFRSLASVGYRAVTIESAARICLRPTPALNAHNQRV
jgi:hypothetical protein